jgi:adhesin transport system outer membrane protein
MSQRDAAMADEDATRRVISEEILSDVALIKSIKNRVKSTQAACEAASSTEQSWQRQFLVGKKAWQDVLNATRELANCKVTLADAKETLLSLNWRLAIYAMGIDQSLGLVTANDEQNNQ